MYVVFARKYRPQRFEDVVGQQHVACTLQNAVRSGRVAHAYLFCGSRGVGKTTMARILARALNCKDGPTAEPCGECEACRRIATGDDMDVMEIDGASNRGIGEVRDLRQNVRLAPAHSRFKVYYIDEVHMLTEPAFNALLKTLEEPPAHVKFIFSTTDPQKLPDTVKSRCQRFDFHRVGDEGIVQVLEQVCEAEGLQMEVGAAAAIARAARGSVRDALGTLDQLAAFGEKASMDDVLGVLGAVDRQVLAEIVDAAAAEEPAAALRAAHEALFSGTDVEDFADQLGEYLRDLLVAACCGPEDPMLAGAMVDAETLKRQCELFTADQITYMVQLLREAKLRARRDTTGRIALELALVKMCRLADLVPLEEALGELSGGRPNPTGAAAPSRAAQQAPAGGRSHAAPSGTLRRMKERLRSRRGNAPSTQAERKAPEGMDEVKYRQMLACADDAATAQEALGSEPLRKAFAAGDKGLGLEPVRVERVAPEPAEEEAEEEAEPEPES
jgi:DNA polymerase-3 subunit gamma/tau